MKKIVSFLMIAVILLTTFTINAEVGNTEPKVKVDAYKIEKNIKDCSIKIIYPYFSGFTLARKLNDLIQNKNINSIGYIGDAFTWIQEAKHEQEKAGEEVSSVGVSLDTNFDYNISGNILSLRINEYSYSGGAHGTYIIDSYTLNTKTNEMYSFKSLFNPKSNYKKVIVDKINKMIDSEKDLYFDNAKQTVAERDLDFQFYVDGSNIVIHFSLYDLRPYAGGIPEFTIPVKELKGLLKDEVYSQIVNAKPLGKTMLNGVGINVPYQMFEQNYSLMVPLRFFTETLGGVVDWDPQKGASIEGGYIKNNVNSYYTEHTKDNPKKLSSAPVTINKRLYVPIEYFKEILNKEVSYDGEVVRIYRDISKMDNQFNNQIVNFAYPTSAKQAVEMYAKAVQERKGAIQYALFSEKLREATKANFEELNWVTGVSSPWVTGYNIKDTGKGNYNIVFHWATSTGKAADSTTKVKVEKVPEREYWQITEVQE